MKKKITLLFLLLLYSALKSADEETIPVSNFYTVVNDNSQKTYIEKKSSGCENACGEKLLECIFSLNIHDQREIFSKITSYKRREFLRRLDIPNYEKFLKLYSEHEWKKLLSTLTEYERSHWPKSVKEQIEAINKIRNDAERAKDWVSHGGGIVLSCINPLFITLQVYQMAMLYKNGIHPVKDNFLKEGFKQYMETTFEI